MCATSHSTPPRFCTADWRSWFYWQGAFKRWMEAGMGCSHNENQTCIPHKARKRCFSNQTIRTSGTPLRECAGHMGGAMAEGATAPQAASSGSASGATLSNNPVRLRLHLRLCTGILATAHNYYRQQQYDDCANACRTVRRSPGRLVRGI